METLTFKNRQKRSYNKPELIAYGSIAKITGGATCVNHKDMEWGGGTC
jgi:hypothetical protein